MREIKFRAWDKKELEMYPNVLRLGLFGNPTYVEAYYLGGDKECNTDDLVLMQYTGLKDKNGKEIHEGDIVTGFDKGIGDFKAYIEFHIDSWVAINKTKICNVYFSIRHLENREVIGNIYETPELLK